jgi:NADP oxidoreductase coenzyme F420-dependent
VVIDDHVFAFSLSSDEMRVSARCLQSLDQHLLRRHTVGFIGLGQMGHSMAANWISKRVVEGSDDTHGFVVCDVDQARAAAFAKTFSETNPRVDISVAATPAE